MTNPLEKIRGEFDCSVRNCKIGVILQCNGWEARQAVEFGKHSFQRNASYKQRNASVTGCQNYAEEEVTIIDDDEGRAIDYDMPGVDSSLILNFTLIAGFVPYEVDLNSIFAGTEHQASGGEWREVEDGFNSLLSVATQANRQLFPPDPILIEQKPYEVATIATCNNYGCVYNAGETHIPPFPMVAK